MNWNTKGVPFRLLSNTDTCLLFLLFVHVGISQTKPLRLVRQHTVRLAIFGCFMLAQIPRLLGLLHGLIGLPSEVLVCIDVNGRVPVDSEDAHSVHP